MVDSSGDSIRILHVDDEPDFADMVATFLQKEDDRFIVETATSAADGREQLAHHDVDCLISDYDMPGQNGIEFLESIREEYPDLPFVLFTGKGSEEVAGEAISAGATDYLRKKRGTEQYELLANRVRNAVEQYRSRQHAVELDRVHTLARDINRALVRADSRPELETRVCEIISDSEPYQFAWIGDIDQDGERVEPRASAGIDEGYLDTITITADETATGQGPGGIAIRERRVAVSQNVAEDPEFTPWRDDALARGYRAVAAVPMEYEDRLYGILGVYAGRPHAFDEPERNLLAELGTDIAHAFHSFEIHDQLQAERNRRRALFENAPEPVIAGEIHDDGTDHRITDVNDAFAEVFGYETGDVVGEDIADVVVPDDGMGVHEAFREKTTAGEPTVAEVERLTVDGLRTFLLHLVPHGSDERPADGWYAWYTDISERRKREQAIEDLHSTTAALMETTTPEQVAETTVETARAILDMPATVVHLYDESEDELAPAAWTDRTEAITGKPSPLAPGEGSAGMTFETGDAQIRDELSTNSRQDEPETNVRSQIALPLDEHGVLVIGSPRPNAFDETDVDLARTLGTHATTTLDRIEHERALRTYETLVETVGDPMYILDREGYIEMANNAFRTFFEASDEAVREAHASDFLTEEDFERCTALLEELRQDTSRESATQEVTAVTTAGERLPAEVNLAPLTDDTGAFPGSVGVARDITDRKDRERALTGTNTVLRTIIDNLPLGILVENSEREVLQANDEFCEVLGFPLAPEELIGRDCATAAEEIKDEFADPDGFVTGIERRITRHEQAYEELDLADGRTVGRYYVPYTLPDGDAHLWLYRDITDRKERERALTQLQQRTETLMQTTTKEETGQVAVDTAHEVLGAELSGCHLVEDDQHRLEPLAFLDAVREKLGEPQTYDKHADADPASQVVWDAFDAGEPLSIEDTRAYSGLAEVTPARSAIIHPLGEYGVFIVSATETHAFDDAQKALSEILATALTAALDRVEREQELRRQIDRLDEFASVISHDLRNPLNVATGRLELAQRECDSDFLDDVADAHDRMATLIDDVLTLAREGKRVAETEPVTLGATIKRYWQTVATADATLVVETNRTIQADPSRLQRLLGNLFRNAVEHGGTDVTVTVGDLSDGFYVADDGPGIPEDERDQVFEIGYSTAATGTGFGLNIVKEIVDAHGWDIRATSSAAGGARFEITGVEGTDA